MIQLHINLMIENRNVSLTQIKVNSGTSPRVPVILLESWSWLVFVLTAISFSTPAYHPQLFHNTQHIRCCAVRVLTAWLGTLSVEVNVGKTTVIIITIIRDPVQSKQNKWTRRRGPQNRRTGFVISWGEDGTKRSRLDRLVWCFFLLRSSTWFWMFRCIQVNFQSNMFGSVKPNGVWTAKQNVS